MSFSNVKNSFQLDESRRERLSATILSLMKGLNLNESQLARESKLPQPTIHRLLSGQTADPRLFTLLQLADYFQISLDQLMGEKSYSNQDISIRSIPILSWQDAIGGAAFACQLRPDNWQHWIATEMLLTKGAYALLSKNSMEPRFPRQSLLLIDPLLIPQDGDLVILRLDDAEEASVREWISDGPKKELKPLLSNHTQPLTYDPLLHQLLGVIAQVRYDVKNNSR